MPDLRYPDEPPIFCIPLPHRGKTVPEDYKVYCINGKPIYIVVFHNRFNHGEELSETVYNTAWEPQYISLDEHFKVSNIVESVPECLEIGRASCRERV